MCGVVCGDGMQVYCDGIDVCGDVCGDICCDVCVGLLVVKKLRFVVMELMFLLLLSCPSIAIHRLGVVKIAP